MTRARADRRGVGLRRARAPLAWLASVYLGVVVGCGHQQQQGPVIRDLRIDGTHAVSPRQIKKKILTSKTGWWPFAHKEIFDPVTWEADLKRIVRLYVARGYYQARVAQESVTPKDKDGVALEVRVAEGEPTRVASLKIVGLDDLPWSDQQAARKGPG